MDDNNLNKSMDVNELATSLCKAQADMKAAEMNSVNPFLKNKYADLGSVIEAARPVLAQHGLSFSQLVSGTNGNVTVTTMLMHASGQWISSSISLPIGEEKGKSMAQVAGSIITYLRRYALSSVLGMYADEDVDGNDAQHQSKDQKKQPDQPKPETKQDKPSLPAQPKISTTRPLDADSLLDALRRKAGTYGTRKASDKQRALLAMLLSNLFEGDNDKRHTLQVFLFGSKSLNDVNDHMILAAIDWLKPTQDSGGAYVVDQVSATEAKTAYHVAAVSEAARNGQQTLPID